MRISATPQLDPCPTCGSSTWVAWRDGILEPVRVDPVRLTVLGELQALALGRETFTHWHGAIDTRPASSITRWPAGSMHTVAIRPEHRCGMAPPDHFPPPPDRTTYTEPPF